jgi:thiosulfate/3-mercaptopyruvate sulfurtransferase
MLTSINLPFNNLFDENGLLLSKTALINTFEAHGVDSHTATITTCGSGVTACTLALALYELGNTDVAVYDGSWAEWGNDETLPITLF